MCTASPPFYVFLIILNDDAVIKQVLEKWLGFLNEPNEATYAHGLLAKMLRRC